MLSLAGCGGKEAMQVDRKQGPPVSVETRSVQTVGSPVFYEATGTVRAELNATLSSKVMARVATVDVREGAAVLPGQVLVALDSRELAAGVEVAQANLSSASVGVDNARTVREMEARTSQARIAQAEAAVQQANAALAAARSKLDLVLAGPRTQERTQAHLAVVQAESNLRLTKTQLDRVSNLVAQGALPKRNLEEAQNAFDLALAQRDSAIQAEKIAEEGSRSQEVQSAQAEVTQAEAAVKQAEANLGQARAAALQARVRSQEVRAAQAQVNQSAAAVRSARVSLGYATVTAPFAGRVVKRSVDPGAMAMPGSPLLTLEGGLLRVEVVVPESVIRHVRHGDEMPVKIDALEREFTARVAEIVPQGDAATHTFLVKLALPKSSSIRSGMYGRASVLIGRSSLIKVPSTAVWERQGLHYAYVVNAESIARLRIVTVGDTGHGQITVLSGLSPGERIVVEGRDRVADGSKVVAK